MNTQVCVFGVGYFLVPGIMRDEACDTTQLFEIAFWGPVLPSFLMKSGAQTSPPPVPFLPLHSEDVIEVVCWKKAATVAVRACQPKSDRATNNVQQVE